jgi:hypothetical protein
MDLRCGRQKKEVRKIYSFPEYLCDEIKEGEIVGACSTCGRDGKGAQNLKFILLFDAT